MPPTRTDSGIIAEVCPKTPPSTPRVASIPLPCENASHVEEAGEKEDAVGYNAYFDSPRPTNPT
jgi:hypothetical protein